jgi:hypothetical protein
MATDSFCWEGTSLTFWQSWPHTIRGLRNKKVACRNKPLCLAFLSLMIFTQWLIPAMPATQGAVLGSSFETSLAKKTKKSEVPFPTTKLCVIITSCTSSYARAIGRMWSKPSLGKKVRLVQPVVANACNASYLGSRAGEDYGLMPGWVKIS